MQDQTVSSTADAVEALLLLQYSVTVSSENVAASSSVANQPKESLSEAELGVQQEMDKQVNKQKAKECDIGDIKAPGSDEQRVVTTARKLKLPVEAPTAKNTMYPANRKQILSLRKSNVAAYTPSSLIPNVEVLRKRAERFGENVSVVLKQLEFQEKMKKRQLRFGPVFNDIKAPGSDEQEKKES